MNRPAKSTQIQSASETKARVTTAGRAGFSPMPPREAQAKARKFAPASSTRTIFARKIGIAA